MLDAGWIYWEPALAAPFGQDSQQVPVLYTLQEAIRWIIVQVTRDPFAAQNIFEILCPPLNAIAFLYVARRAGLGYPAAIPCAVLYGNLYAVYMRIIWGHPFLAAYWVIPIACAALLTIASAAPWSWSIVVAGALLGLESHYEAFFGCTLALAAIAIGSIQSGTLRSLRNGIAFLATAAVAFVVNDAPTIIWTLTHHARPYVLARIPVEAYLYSLTLVGMISPVPDHHIHALAVWRGTQDGVFPILVNENAAATLGIVATAGLCILAVALVARRSSAVPRFLEHSALLTAAAVALATTGGLGVWVNTFLTPDVRAYNRISPFIACFCLLGVAWVLQRLWRRASERGRTVVYLAGAVLLTLVGLYDETPAHVPPYAHNRERVAIDAAWVKQIEAVEPGNAAILELPYVSFPDMPPVEQLPGHFEAVPYLFSDRLRWSFGAVEGSDAARAEKALAATPPAALLAAARRAGFDGILVYRAGFADHAAAIDRALRSQTGCIPLVNDDATQVFYRMNCRDGNRRSKTRAQHDPRQ